MIGMIMIGTGTQTVADWKNSTTHFYRTDSHPTTAITEQQAITIAQRHFKGRVLAIHHADNFYRIKILNPQGKIHIILINAQDGTVASAH
jgi:uncharacterized membrane protein YkoI